MEKTFYQSFPACDHDPQYVLSDILVITSSDITLSSLAEQISRVVPTIHGLDLYASRGLKSGITSFHKYSMVPTVFLINPSEIQELSPFGVSPAEQQTLVSQSQLRANLIVQKTKERWLVFCIANTVQQQLRLLLDLAKKSEMPESIAID
jgi:hypothetical protein